MSQAEIIPSAGKWAESFEETFKKIWRKFFIVRLTLSPPVGHLMSYA